MSVASKPWYLYHLVTDQVGSGYQYLGETVSYVMTFLILSNHDLTLSHVPVRNMPKRYHRSIKDFLKYFWSFWAIFCNEYAYSSSEKSWPLNDTVSSLSWNVAMNALNCFTSSNALTVSETHAPGDLIFLNRSLNWFLLLINPNDDLVRSSMHWYLTACCNPMLRLNISFEMMLFSYGAIAS